jgi:hypothetical protein
MISGKFVLSSIGVLEDKSFLTLPSADKIIDQLTALQPHI